MEFLRVLLFAGILVSQCIIAISEGKSMIDLASSSSSCEFPAIYNFGDSNSDTGAMAAAFYPMILPAGETYFGRAAGRASDGRLIIDFIAEHVGLPFLSAYLDSIGTSYRYGANFAASSSTITRQNESWFLNGVSPFPLEIQVEHYTQFKERTAYLYNQANVAQRSRLPRPKDFSKALYTFDIGQNDLADGYRTLGEEELRASLPNIVNQFALQIQDLYKKGARVFWVHNTGPMGCMPVAVLTAENPEPGFFDEIGCVKNQNEMAMEFNKLLKNAVIRLRSKLRKASLIYVDMYKAKYELISNAHREGFESSFTVCCGIHDTRNSVWCGKEANINGTKIFTGSCGKPSSVISWDGVHYTDAANRWIATRIADGSLSDPPVPISRACHS
ncbi:hypothetical protein M9H77_31271 [Catharanthus roseus]|uniref:Uncharacterized protein n=1 Tax=Catharanthus roseus TaxID=4058 RepID=A0ACB9ZZY0_CATRO|nr:hypothetical protein M9H77_31271 [Catharanthus roseus]